MGQRGRKTLFDLSQRLAAPAVFQANLELVGINNGAEVHSDLCGSPWVAQLPEAVMFDQPLIAVVCLQRVAPSGRKIEAGVKGRARQIGIGARGRDFGIE